jgi:hypothetical protein
MKAMKSLIVRFLLIVVPALTCEARAVRSLEMKALVEGSALVFVGTIKSVKRLGITTELTYPTWNDVVFEWLKVEVEVVEPIKGTSKGAVVRTLMLSTRGNGPMVNPPGMVKPKVGEHHLHCLLPTTFEGVYASITAPFDDDQGILLLDRRSWTEGGPYYNDGNEVPFPLQNDRNAVLWNLVDHEGRINPIGAEEVRKKYKMEIAKLVPKEAVIHLKWKKEESDGGWQWNVPDDGKATKKRKQPEGPVTKP